MHAHVGVGRVSPLAAGTAGRRGGLLPSVGRAHQIEAGAVLRWREELVSDARPKHRARARRGSTSTAAARRGAPRHGDRRVPRSLGVLGSARRDRHAPRGRRHAWADRCHWSRGRDVRISRRCGARRGARRGRRGRPSGDCRGRRERGGRPSVASLHATRSRRQSDPPAVPRCGRHRGHVRRRTPGPPGCVGEVRRQADELGAPAVVVSFDQHPATVVRPESAPRLLTSQTQKLELFGRLGVDYAHVLRFDEERSLETPEHFLDEIVVGTWHTHVRGRRRRLPLRAPSAR